MCIFRCAVFPILSLVIYGKGNTLGAVYDPPEGGLRVIIVSGSCIHNIACMMDNYVQVWVNNVRYIGEA